MTFPFIPMTCMQGKPRIFFASALQVQEFTYRFKSLSEGIRERQSNPEMHLLYEHLLYTTMAW